MEKGKLIGKIFGIALVLVMIGPMLGGSLSTLNIASADDSNGVGEDPFNYQGQYIIDQAKLSGEENETLPYVQKYAQEQGISPALLMAIIKQESNFSPNAIGDSGLAIGYMQLHWDAAYDAGYRSARGGNTEEEKKAYAREDWPICGLDPFTNIKYGCGYLRICYNKHKDSSVYNDPLKNAISAYNLGWPHGPDKSNENSYVNPIVEAYKDYKTKYITYAKYGDIIGVYRGVKAFSNGPCTAKFEGIYEGQNCALPKNRNYQCVEYVKRFYKEAMGIDTHGWYGNANQYYGTAREKGLKAYPNGGSIAPQAGDILCFDDGGLGHVAIIMEVGDANIQIIEQNWHRNTAYDTLSWDKDNNTIPDRGISRSYQVQGWLRSPISAGLYYLRKHQNTNGSWQNNVGITSMAALAFLNAGYIARCDPAISKAIQYILNNCHDGSFGGTYETSAAVWALVAIHNPDYNDEISDAKDWLVNAQYDEGEGIDSTNPYYGGWSYGSNPSWADLSNTQFALMALDAAGLHKSSTTWTKAIKYVSRCQNRPASNDQGWAHDDTRPSYNDGGFIYCPEWSFVGQTGSYGSITAGGVWSLRLCGVDVTDPRVQAGLKWLAENEDCSFDDNPGHPYDQGHCFLYYYYMTTAKSLTMCFLDDLGDVDWYAALSTKLADLQYDDGHWVNAPVAHGQEDIAELATDYALLALQLQQRPLANLWMSIILASNADLCVYDPQGRHACLGDITIPGATFEIDAEGRQIVNLKELEAGKYRIELTGTADGGYSLTIEGYRDEEQTSSETFEGTISEGEVQKSDTLVTSMVGTLTIYVEEPEPLLVTGLLNVRLIAADPTVNQINVSSLDLSEIDETYKPEEVISKYAYLVDAMGTGNFTLEFTDIVGANTIKVYKIDPTLTPPNQWVELDYTTTADTVTFTMAAGDPPIVFGGRANMPPVADAGPDQTVCVIPPATTAEVMLDGSGSYDPDVDPLTYNWTWDGNTTCGVNPAVELPLGTTTITLVVNDGKVDSELDTVDITVWIRATIDFDPDTLNLKSKGKFVTVYIELPPGHDVGQISVSSIRLNGTIPALGKPTKIGDYDSDGIPDLMVKFNRAAVQDALTVGEEVEVTITGEVTGILFEGSDTIITVGTPATSATRTLPAASVAAGANFDVNIEASGCGSFGQVAETLPTGFSYVDTTSTDVSVAEVGNTVKFTFMGDSVSFTYTVTASTTAGTYSFSGVVKDDDTTEYTVGGDTIITVGAGAATSATRTLPAASVAAPRYLVAKGALACEVTC